MNVKEQHFDFIVMQGGVNDAWGSETWGSAEVGAMSSSFKVEDFNVATYAGALEELFYHVTKNHSNAKLGYMFTFKAPRCGAGRVKDMTEYYNVAKQICEKWNVPFLNMYEDEKLNEELKVDTNEYLPDFIHPNTAGYNILYKYIMYWMETLPVYSEIEEGYQLQTFPSDVLPAVPELGCGGIWTKFY
jgi:lysophospholipase L1-like esterase